MDVESIPKGVSWNSTVTSALDATRVMLVFIGRSWLRAAGEDGRRRIDLKGDIVRYEIQSGLQRGIPIIPIVIAGAEMPTARQLPKAIRDLADLQCVTMTHTQFRSECPSLLDRIEDILDS